MTNTMHTESTSKRTTLHSGTKVACIDKMGDEYIVSVWHDNGKQAARWFKGHSTCSNEYKTYRGADRAARKFLGIE